MCNFLFELITVQRNAQISAVSYCRSRKGVNGATFWLFCRIQRTVVGKLFFNTLKFHQLNVSKKFWGLLNNPKDCIVVKYYYNSSKIEGESQLKTL